jgi:hypothetical protein
MSLEKKSNYLDSCCNASLVLENRKKTNNMVEDSSPNSLKKTKCIYYHKRAVVDHSNSDNLSEPFVMILQKL